MKFLISNSSTKHLWVLLVHVILGFVILYFPLIVAGWYYFILLVAIFTAISQRDSGYVILLIAYNLGIEIIGRMLNVQPYIPWEMNKYLTPILFVLIVIIDNFKKSNMVLGLIVVLLSIPGWLFGNSATNRLVFSMMGIINLGLMVALFYNRKISLSFLLGIFRAVVLPLVSILSYITIKTPSFSDIQFSLGANFSTTGGFGSNQMSTILGVGVLIMAMAVMIQKTLFYKPWIDMLLAGYFLFRGLLSFSRGGVLVAVLSFFVFFYFIRMSKILYKYRITIRKIDIRKVIIILIGFVFVFVIANNITHGVLLDRYKGETNKTLSGKGEKTLDSFTTGRWEIMVSDLEMWRDHIIWGVGGGNSAFLRPQYGVQQIVAHTEFSRLLADQGMFGLFILIIVTFFIPYNLLINRNSMERSILLSLYVLGFLTSFHAGMRTFVTPFFVGLSTVYIYPAMYFKKQGKI